MALPKEIFPNPLVTSTIEVRFSSKLEASKLLSLVYGKFLNSLPTLTENKIPKEVRENNLEFAFASDYTLSNEDYSLSFGNNVIAFENISEYKLWGNYFPFISYHLKSFFDLDIINYIDRIGVRYASVLDKTESIDQVLKNIPTIPIEGYSQKFNYYRSNLVKQDFDLLLQIANNAKATKNDVSLSGVYIDIDASYSENLQPDETVISIIDKLHLQQKELFFSLLRPDFINTLNPIY